MLTYLLRVSPTDAAIWLVIGLLQGLVAAACYHGRACEKYRAFTTYMSFATLLTFTLMALPPGPGFHTYIRIYSPGFLMQEILMAFSIRDLYRETLGPRQSLPDWAPRNLGILLSLAVAVSFAIGIIFKPALERTAFLRLVGLGHAVMLIGMALALWILVFYARRLGLGWWPRDLQIGGPFVLMVTIHAIAFAVIWTGWFGHMQAARMAQRFGQTASILAYGYWSWALWEKEQVQARATPEEVAAVLAVHRDNMRAIQLAKEILG